MMTSSEEDIWNKLRGLLALGVSVTPEKSLLLFSPLFTGHLQGDLDQREGTREVERFL